MVSLEKDDNPWVVPVILLVLAAPAIAVVVGLVIMVFKG